MGTGGAPKQVMSLGYVMDRGINVGPALAVGSITFTPRGTCWDPISKQSVISDSQWDPLPDTNEVHVALNRKKINGLRRVPRITACSQSKIHKIKKKLYYYIKYFIYIYIHNSFFIIIANNRDHSHPCTSRASTYSGGGGGGGNRVACWMAGLDLHVTPSYLICPVTVIIISDSTSFYPMKYLEVFINIKQYYLKNINYNPI